MGNSIRPTDLYKNFNALIGQSAGGALAGVDLKDSITVGQAATMYGYENTLNALSAQLARTLLGVRPYTSRFNLIESDAETYGTFLRKISYFYDDFQPSTDWNTDITSTQLNDGNSIDEYPIHKRYPLEMNFGGTKVLQKEYTRFLEQLKLAFSSAEQFDAFYRGEAIQLNNEIQMMKEAENRALVLNAIGATYNTGTPYQKINLCKLYQDETGQTIPASNFLSNIQSTGPFIVETIKYLITLLERPTDLYHLTPSKTSDAGNKLKLYRHTPRSEQRLLLNSKIQFSMETNVLPFAFHDGYLKQDAVEYVPYWQTPTDPYAVNLSHTSEFDISNGMQKDGAAVNLKTVVGVLFDRSALMTSYRQTDVLTTPVNARGRYYNTAYHWAKDYRYDPTENMIVLYVEDVE